MPPASFDLRVERLLLLWVFSESGRSGEPRPRSMSFENLRCGLPVSNDSLVTLLYNLLAFFVFLFRKHVRRRREGFYPASLPGIDATAVFVQWGEEVDEEAKSCGYDALAARVVLLVWRPAGAPRRDGIDIIVSRR